MFGYSWPWSVGGQAGNVSRHYGRSRGRRTTIHHHTTSHLQSSSELFTFQYGERVTPRDVLSRHVRWILCVYYNIVIHIRYEYWRALDRFSIEVCWWRILIAVCRQDAPELLHTYVYRWLILFIIFKQCVKLHCLIINRVESRFRISIVCIFSRTIMPTYQLREPCFLTFCFNIAPSSLKLNTTFTTGTI